MLAWVLWWIDAAVAVAVCVYLPWAMCVFFFDFWEEPEFVDLFCEISLDLEDLECVFPFPFLKEVASVRPLYIVSEG